MNPDRATEPTSLEAYSQIEPTLAERERAVLLGLRRFREQRGIWPTAYELFRFMYDQGIGHVQDLNSVRPRLTALYQAHLVEHEREKRPCTITGITALTWRLPDTSGRLF
jgi:hypothetical protein